MERSVLREHGAPPAADSTLEMRLTGLRERAGERE
jgi:hypothetical protein